MSYRRETQDLANKASPFSGEHERLLRELCDTRKLLFTRGVRLLAGVIVLVVLYACKRFFGKYPGSLALGYGILIFVVLLVVSAMAIGLPLCYKIIRIRMTIRSWKELEADLNATTQ
jgi:MFS superfamily sulfate permease-like transporter